jgi:hypothetical protein
MEIGNEELYKSGGGINKVVELATYYSTCIKQLVNDLPDGFYNLKYTFFAAVSLSLSTVFVYFNGIKID